MTKARRAAPRLTAARSTLCAAAALAALIQAVPASALNLGGTDVPKDKIVVYLFIGHSNMVGRDGDMDTTTHPRCWNYNIPNPANWNEGWVPAKAPIHTDFSHKGGPGMPFLKKLAELYPGYHIGIIQNANTQASIEWVNGQGGQNRYKKGYGLYNELMNAANAIRGQVTFGGIVAMLGYMDANSSTYAPRFADDMAQTVRDMRADLGTPGLPFLIGKFEVNAAAKPSQWTTIRDQINQVPSKLSRTALVPYAPASGEYVDDHHFSRQGHRKWSESAANLIQSNGWFPLSQTNSPPTVSITDPSNGAVFNTGEDVYMKVNASDSDGSIAKVEFYVGQTLVYTAYSAPYEHTWTNAQAGSYAITARAYDDNDATASDSVNISITTPGNAPPSVSITQPSSGSTFSDGDDVYITADASDPDGSISKVEFYRGSTLLHTETVAPYEYTWLSVSAGSYTITVKAYDDKDATATDSASITVTGGSLRPALFVVANVALNDGDAATKARLEQLGFAVTVVDDGASQASDADGKALVVISSTCGSGDVNSKFRDVPVPAVVWETYIWDDMQMTGAVEGTDYGYTGGQDSITIVDPSHPLAGGLTSGTVQVQTSQTLVRWGRPNQNAAEVATFVGEPERITIFGYERGVTMAGGIAAPARRAGVFFDDSAPAKFNADGWALFDAAVQWATDSVTDPPPSAPANLAATAAGWDQIDLDWDDNTEPDFASYSVHRDTTPGFTPSASNRFSSGLTVNHFSVGGLSESTTYYFVVVAVDTNGNVSGPSNVASAETGVYTAPGVTVVSPNGGEVLYVGTTRRIRWTATNIDNVEVSYSTDNGSTWTIVGYVLRGSAEWGQYEWVVPDEPSAECLVNVADYNDLAVGTSAGTFEIRTVTDTDDDGMDDDWETEHFGNLFHDGSKDTDGDGQTDYEEFMAGTDPVAGQGASNDGAVGFGCAAPGGPTGAALTLALVGLALAACARRSRVLRSCGPAPAGSEIR